MTMMVLLMDMVGLMVATAPRPAAAGTGVYEQAPWTGDGTWVSLETHEDGSPFVPVPGDGGQCGALEASICAELLICWHPRSCFPSKHLVKF